MKPRAERGIMPGLGAGSRTALGGERRALIRAVAQEQRSQLLPVGRFSSCPLPSVFLWLAVQDFNIPINISNADSDQVGEGIFEEGRLFSGKITSSTWRSCWLHSLSVLRDWMLWGHGLQNELCNLGPYQQHKSELGCQLKHLLKWRAFKTQNARNLCTVESRLKHTWRNSSA